MSPNQPLSETEKAYLAGFLDGEGCIHIGKARANRENGGVSPNYGLAVIFCQSELFVLEHWQSRLGIGAIHETTPPDGVNSWGIKCNKRLYQWTIIGPNAELFLRQVYPYLITKREQAQVAFDFRATQHGGPGGRGRTVPNTVIDLREHYRLALMGMKKPGDPLVLEPRLNRLAELLASQLTFDLDAGAA